MKFRYFLIFSSYFINVFKIVGYTEKDLNLKLEIKITMTKLVNAKSCILSKILKPGMIYNSCFSFNVLILVIQQKVEKSLVHNFYKMTTY